MKNLIERSYKATVKRGLITPQTTDYEFIGKIHEELTETIESWESQDQWIEVADIILTCMNWARHRDIDIIEIMKSKTIYNEKRTD